MKLRDKDARKGKETVTGTQTVPMALFVAKTIAEMDLVKTAVYPFENNSF